MPSLPADSGSGSESPDKRGSSPDPKREIDRAVVAAAVSAAVGTAVTWILNRLVGLPVWLGALLIVVVFCLVLAVIFRRQAAKWARSSWRVSLTCVIAFALALAANAVWRGAFDDANQACGGPVDLRIVAAPETVTALRSAAQEYEHDRCPAANISVVPEPPIAGTEAGFTNGWTESSTPSTDTLYGPQPDIWIADSKIVADGVLRFVQRSNSGNGKAHLDIEQPVASSPIVLGLFRDDTAGAAQDGIQQDGTSHGTTLSELITDLRAKEILGGTDNVLRAVPDTSESALLATPALYNMSSRWEDDAHVEENQIRLPEQIFGSAQAFPDATALLCNLRKEQASGAKPPTGTALLLTEQSIFTYDTAGKLGDSCPVGTTQQNWKLYPYYASDLPVLDYTFVHVRWSGQDDAGRYRTVEDLRQWLAKNSATALPGFRDPGGHAGKSLLPSMSYTSANYLEPPPSIISPRFPRYSRCGGDFTNIMNCYDDARPRLVATILLDVSGSMAATTANGLSRLAWAQQTGVGIAQLAHPEDSLSFQPFGRSVNASEPPGLLTQQALVSGLNDQVANGLDMPFATEIGDVIGNLPSGRQNVVVLTDGQRIGTNPGYAEAARELAADIRDHHRGLRIFLLLASGASCTSEPVKTLTSELRSAGEGDCIPASTSPAASAAELFTDLLK